MLKSVCTMGKTAKGLPGKNRKKGPKISRLEGDQSKFELDFVDWLGSEGQRPNDWMVEMGMNCTDKNDRVQTSKKG